MYAVCRWMLIGCRIQRQFHRSKVTGRTTQVLHITWQLLATSQRLAGNLTFNYYLCCVLCTLYYRLRYVTRVA